MVTAAFITGKSLLELWRARKKATKQTVKLLWLNIAIWVMAIIWSVLFWGVFVPVVIYNLAQ